jgi:hypothetical protein
VLNIVRKKIPEKILLKKIWENEKNYFEEVFSDTYLFKITGYVDLTPDQDPNLATQM